MIGQYVRIESNEMLSGWLHYLAEINGVDDGTFAKYLYGKEYPVRKNIAFNYEKFLPAIIKRIGEKMTPNLSELFRSHMTVTERFPFSSSERQAELAGRYLISPLSTEAFIFHARTETFKPKFCPICALEDLKQHGRIILYTEHHLSGMVSCYKHHVKLIQTNGYPTPEDIQPTKTVDVFTAKTDVFAVDLFRRGWAYTSEDLKRAFIGYAESLGARDVYALIETYDDGVQGKKDILRLLYSADNHTSPRRCNEFMMRLFGNIDNLSVHLHKHSLEDYLSVISPEEYQIDSYDGLLLEIRCKRCGRSVSVTPALLEAGFGCACRTSGMSESEVIKDILKKKTSDFSLDRYIERDKIYLRHIPCGTVSKFSIINIVWGTLRCQCQSLVKKEDRIGEQNRNLSGNLMTIIRYENSKDIDVQFENGIVVQHRKYVEFKKGKIGLPFRYSEKYMGQTSVNSDGNIMTIIGYYNYSRCIVSFEDGSKKVCRMDEFKKGNVKKPQKVLFEDGSWGFPMASEKLLEVSKTEEGLEATLICFRNEEDVDVALENGEVITNLTYEDFKKGKVVPERVNTALMEGRVAISKCGQTMTIVKHRSATDIDVQFEDGTTLQHVSYRAIRNGSLLPNMELNAKAAERVGVRVRSEITGQMMEVIEYYSDHNITVRFDTGDIYYKKRYSSFIRGRIGNPEYKKRSRLHQKNNNNKDETMEIIRYGTASDIDVQFEDGTIVTHKEYANFLSGNIVNPNSLYQNKTTHIGESSIAHNGMRMTIISYRGCFDVDIKFEDGTIVKHKAYSCFKSGYIAYPKSYSKYLGEEGVACNGMKTKIIRCKSLSDIDVEMEDGIVLKHRKYHQFKTGNIGIKEYNRLKRIGEKNKNLSGQTMMVIEYFKENNITVQFDDGTIVKNKTYGNFKKGFISKGN